MNKREWFETESGQLVFARKGIELRHQNHISKCESLMFSHLVKRGIVVNSYHKSLNSALLALEKLDNK